LLDSHAAVSSPEPTPSDSVPLPARGEGVAVAALAMSAFVLNLNSNVMGALLPFVRGEFGFGDDGGAMLLAAAGAGSAVGALVVADAGRRLGRRAVLGGSLAVFVAASVAHLLVHSYWPLLVARALSGFASGLAYAAASAAAADLAPYERRAAVMGRFNAGMFLAIPVGLPLTVWLASLGWWPATFALQAAVGVAALALTVRCVPPLPPAPTARRLPLLANGGVLAVLIATTLHVGSFFTVVQLATSWLDDEGIVAKEDQVWLWVGLGALSVLGSAGFGKLADRVGKRRFVLVTSGALVVCFFVLSRSWGADYLLPVGCLLAVAAAARTGPLQALVSGLVPSEQLGALMGLRGFCMQLGVFLFAVGASGLTERMGFRGVLLLGAGCQLGSYLAIRLGVREPRPAAAEAAAPRA
jgi:predicted MFS family arabinose efflux permease